MLSKEYQNTAQTLRSIERNMANQTIGYRLEVLAKDYERRVEKACRSDKASALLALPVERETTVQE